MNIAATLPLNFNLAVGAASTTVNVAGVTAAPIETQSYQLSNVIDAKQITNLPLVLRDPYQLVLLSSGAVTASNNDGGFAINGQRDRNNNFLLDGADNNDTSVPGIPGGLVSANPDSAQEFRVITNNFDAEFGRNTGAIVDVVTRGGTNRFHGGAYEFGRYNALGARDFFNTKANGPQDPYVRNDFGASLGGPLQKDKLFFFLNGEVQRFRTTRTANQLVPTAAFKSGIFTYVDPVDGSQTPVNLTTGPANPNNLTGLPSDPTMAKLLAITPLGQQDTGDGVSSFLFFPSPDSLNDYTLTGRLDYALSAKHQLTVRYTYGHSAESNPTHSEVLPGIGYLRQHHYGPQRRDLARLHPELEYHQSRPRGLQPERRRILLPGLSRHRRHYRAGLLRQRPRHHAAVFQCQLLESQWLHLRMRSAGRQQWAGALELHDALRRHADGGQGRAFGEVRRRVPQREGLRPTTTSPLGIPSA